MRVMGERETDHERERFRYWVGRQIEGEKGKERLRGKEKV